MGQKRKLPPDRVTGTGIDCLEDIEVAGGGISLNRTTFFRFPRGDLGANGITTVIDLD